MRCLVGWRVVVGAVLSCALGCWSSSSSTRAYGTGGTAWVAPGSSGGLAGAGGTGGEGGGIECGSVRCAAGMICCNVACGICAPPGAGCVAGCPATGGSGGGGSGGIASAGSGGVAGGGSAGNAGRAGASGGAGSGGSVGGAGPGSVGGAGGVVGGAGGVFSSVLDGGTPVDAAVTCDDLHNQYAASLLAAERCTVDAGDQCTKLVDHSFPFERCGLGCGLVYVNDGSALSLPFQQALAAHCALGSICGLACETPTGGVCIATDGGSGVCETLFGGPLGQSVVHHPMF
jgi:hypothetical protein